MSQHTPPLTHARTHAHAQVGAYLSWFVRFLMLLTGVITWPIGKLLDWMLGEESALFRWARA